MKLTRVRSILAILSAFCATPALCQGTDRLTKNIPLRSDVERQEGLSPEWFSVAAARTSDGRDNFAALPDKVTREVDLWLGDVSRGHAKKDGCIGEVVKFESDPPTKSGRWPDTLAEFALLGRTVVVGKIRERADGFIRGWAGTALWIEVEEELRTTPAEGAARVEKGFAFMLPVAAFEFGGYRFCRRDDLIKTLPEVGDRVLLISDSATTAPNLVPVSCRARTTSFVIERSGTKEVVVSGIPETGTAALKGLPFDALVQQTRTVVSLGRREDW